MTVHSVDNALNNHSISEIKKGFRKTSTKATASVNYLPSMARSIRHAGTNESGLVPHGKQHTYGSSVRFCCMFSKQTATDIGTLIPSSSQAARSLIFPSQRTYLSCSRK